MTTEEIEAKLVELEATVIVLSAAIHELTNVAVQNEKNFTALLDQMTKAMESKG